MQTLLVQRYINYMERLETFPNPSPGRRFLITHVLHEFTSVCPLTGLPDFAKLL